MKQKTSVSISPDLLDVLKREARRQDRSVSYLLEKFMEQKAGEIAVEEIRSARVAEVPTSEPA